MTFAAFAVLVAEAGAFLFFTAYLGVLTLGSRDDDEAPRAPALDATGRSLFTAARSAFATGILAVVALTVWTVAGSLA
ncbi:MAG: hypothetical protein CMN87_15870 [Stappia sp.]|uniref:hypothetical protein n=1 Tax=Stappia sp. TaxID=1870903 RepID=UPI000C43F3FD|nr:hypothetical protein [Stappia sp.]MAB00875.1 hypothetical protein [Stappia sp.]MBM21484.1 hypothetical protein [Stappia sp.]